MVSILSKWFAAFILIVAAVSGLGQNSRLTPFSPPISTFDAGTALSAPELDPAILARAALPVVSPDLALRIFEGQGQQQSSALRGYTDDTLVIAELSDTSQRGAFELQREYVAPRSLRYKPVTYTGDTFVKSSVITRVLQSEVDYVEKGDPGQTALTSTNYKFSYKGDQELNGNVAHVYQVKPRHKRAGLFKGHIFLDAHTGNLLRSEGAIQSPSFFVRKIEFVQDCAAIGRYTFPVHLHTTARTRILGKVVMDVYHRDYQPQPFSASLSQHETPVGQ